MTDTLRVPVQKEIWYWAVEESQKSLEEISTKFPQIQKWISGEIDPTFKQLERFADYLRIPFGYLFLESPPSADAMEVEFRSINNKLPAMSRNLKDIIMEMDFRKNWMSDYRKELGWEKLEIIVQFNKHKSGDIALDAALAKQLLGLEDDWATCTSDYHEAFKLLREKLEKAGILVMQNGIVGMNTHRKLDINEFRAFMLYDDVSPLIFINSNDSQGGKVFSLIHEYFHVLFERDNLFLNEDLDATKENEKQVNQLTAEFLMPSEQVHRVWRKNADPVQQIKELSKAFKVSEAALAIKLRDLNCINDTIVKLVIDESTKNFENRKNRENGGNFYHTFFAKISPTFAAAVIREAEQGGISYTYAFRLLGGIKGKSYDKLKERLMPYG